MKKLLFLAALGAVLLASCKKDEGNDNGTIAAIEIRYPDDLEELELDYSNPNRKLEFSWLPASDASLQYKLIFSLDEQLQSPQTIDAGTVAGLDVSHQELEQLLERLGVRAYHRGEVFWTVEVQGGAGSKRGDVRSMKVFRFLKPFTDPRDNEEYRVCRIVDPVTGDYAVWMAENLRATTYADGTALPGYRMYDGDDPARIKVYGAYYDWNTVMRGNRGAEEGEKIQGIAPDGWHIPTKNEWDFIINSADVGNGPATELKDKEWWDPSSINVGTNSGGFGMPGAGYIWTNSNPDHAVLESGAYAYYWTATQPVSGDVFPWDPPAAEFPNQATTYGFNKDDFGAALYPYPKERGFSVRCVAD